MALTMTLGQNKMYNVIQHSAPQANCVIVTQQTSGKRPLAPAPERTSVLVANNSDLRCKRKIQFSPYGAPPQQPASVARRNARERNRVKQVNNGFATLRSHIPGRGASKKLSKVETLRLAVEYIRSLQQMIEDYESDVQTSNPAHASTSDIKYYSANTDSNIYQGSYPVLLPTPACSEASVSPTPSHSSEGSFSTQSYTGALYHHAENYENYDPKSPDDDEELLDAIFSWQQE
ncbi:unnamed protein product [Acanthoscelides obtectus]|uniref:BHLH domain-containing protein n=1 Tax=Acanthoscelides obtectus TaxID=200917 RepID=A0A9P0K410_ACAOB|nr:unnamed protein product [Acanthoscelides obtectus]CAK1676672.1 Achaete-scute homolog 1a [Acanthoscelides obtectus]